jgi:hypothetical protein
MPVTKYQWLTVHFNLHVLRYPSLSLQVKGVLLREGMTAENCPSVIGETFIV